MEEYLSEREQWERVLAWLREQGPWMLAAVAIVAAGFGGARYWQARVQQRGLAASAQYRQILDAFSRNDLSGGLRLVDILVKDFPTAAYADQADLAAARIQVENNQLDQAATRLSRVLGSTKDPELALIARLRLARVQLAQNQLDEALKTLNAVDAGGFAPRFAAVRGDVLLAKGDRNGALREYRAARAAGAGSLDTGLLDLKINELARL